MPGEFSADFFDRRIGAGIHLSCGFNESLFEDLAAAIRTPCRLTQDEQEYAETLFLFLNSVDGFFFVLADGKYCVELRHLQLRMYLR